MGDLERADEIRSQGSLNSRAIISSSLQALGDPYFDSSRAWRNDAIAIAGGIMSAVLAGLSLWLEYQGAGSTSIIICLLLLGSLCSAGLVACWATYLRVGMERILTDSYGVLDVRWTQPMRLRNETRRPTGSQRVGPKTIPLSWRSPLSTTLWRLRLALVATVGLFSWSIFSTGASVATHVLTWAPVVFLAFGSLICLCHYVPIILVDNARRRFRDADIGALLEPTIAIWPVRFAAVTLGLILMVLSLVQLAQRAIPLIDDSTHLRGQSTTMVELSRSTQTFYVGCSDDLVCSPLAPSDITVISTATHTAVPVVADEGVDHQSFHEHPWLSVANANFTVSGHYLVTLGGAVSGEYCMALSQSEVFRTVLPMIGLVVWRVIALWLAGATIYEALYFRRIRTKMSRGERVP